MVMKKIIFNLLVIIVSLSCNSQSVRQPSSPVVFQSGFEEEKPAWDDYDDNSDVQYISDPGPFNATENHVLRLAVPAGKGGGSDLIKVLPSQHDSMYVRWYIKYEEGFDFSARHHGSGLFAGNRNFLGKSDYRPNGDDYAISTIEHSRKLHTTQIYAYYRGMYQDCSNPQGACWGDVFPCTSDDGTRYCKKKQHREPPLPPELQDGKWYLIEMKLKLGTPSEDGSVHDGEIALWVDGQNYGIWNDLWMRTTEDLKVSVLWLLLYHHDGNHSEAGILLDDVVVSTTRTGPGRVPVFQ